MLDTYNGQKEPFTFKKKTKRFQLGTTWKS